MRSLLHMTCPFLFITTKIKAPNCQDKGNSQLLFAILVHTSISFGIFINNWLITSDQRGFCLFVTILR